MELLLELLLLDEATLVESDLSPGRWLSTFLGLVLSVVLLAKPDLRLTQEMETVIDPLAMVTFCLVILASY
jgi:hypothetical protein